MFKKGYSTIHGFIVLAILTAATLLGVDVPIESFPINEESALLVISIAFGILNRFRTTTAVGEEY
jgi:uncharacterized membrane protein YvlD (DUF360 family)